VFNGKSTELKLGEIDKEMQVADEGGLPRGIFDREFSLYLALSGDINT
jgi:hypothetical protein